ncbi:MAG TPA: uracil-DNA glycosylase [Thermoanaerobaculia bacterium]
MDETLRRELALLRDLGFTHLDLSSTARAAEAGGATQSTPPPAGGGVLSVAPAPSPALGSIVTADSLEQLGVIAAPCTRCRLAATRTQVVFGVGNPSADLMFIGEAPGRDEDLKGEPFVGRAGQLLTDIIKAMKLRREDVYIANVIKCRPPENRNPEPDELDACRPYIRKQVEMIRPKVIVTLGKFGLQSLLEKAFSISSVRGSWLEYEGIKVMPTYHPAYLLRTPAAKKDVWNDMKKVMAELGIAF